MKTNHSKHKNRSGISLVLYREEPQSKKLQQPWHLMFKKWIFCYLAVLFVVRCLYVSLKAEVNEEFLYVGMAVFSLLYIIGYLLKGKIKMVYHLGFLILAAIFVFLKRELIVNGFYVFENVFLQRMEERFKITTWRYIVGQEPVVALTAFLMVCAIVLILVVTQEVMRHYLEMIYFLYCFMVVGIIMAVGLVPEVESFTGMLIICFMMIMMEGTPGIQLCQRERRIGEERGFYTEKMRLRIALLGASFFVVSYLMISFVFSKETYQTKVDMEKPMTFLRERYADITLKTRNFILFGDSDIDSFTTASGGLAGGMLDEADQVSFDGSTQLYVSADAQTDFLYLKGYAGTFYAGNRWIRLSKGMREDYENLLSQYADCTVSSETLVDEMLKQMQQQRMLPEQFFESAVWVTYEAANQKYLYAPYFNDFQTCSIKNSCDLYAYPKNPTNQYYFENVFTSKGGLFGGINDEVAFITAALGSIQREDKKSCQFERAYRAYVKKYYQILPKTGLLQLKKIVFTSQKEGVEKTQDLVSQVVSYLSDHTKYSLSPGRTPEGKDFTENFLFTTHKGYCAHYATAAVLLLRNSGVPARYCEGYLISKKDFLSGTEDGILQVPVPDSSAHAWVEVYYDGIGWLPCEVTKGYGIAESRMVSKEIKKASLEKETGEQSKVTKIPSETVKTDSKEESKIRTFPWFVMGTGAFILLLFIAKDVIVHCYIQRKIKRHLYSGDRKKQVTIYFYLMERVFTYLEIVREQSTGDYEYMRTVQERVDWLPGSYQKVIDIVLAACYSEKEPTTDEVLMVKDCYKEILHYYLSDKSAIIRIFIKYRYNLVE